MMIAIMSPELLYLCEAAINESERFPNAAHAFFEGGMVRVVDRLSEVLSSASSAGEVEIEDCSEAAALFVAMLRGNIHFEAALELRSIPTVEEIETRTEATVDLFLAGLRRGAAASE